MNENELARYHKNKLQIKALEEENAEILGELGLRSMTPGVYTEGRYTVEVTPNVRFDPALAAELFPFGEDGQNAHLYVAQVDSSLAKKHLSPADYQRAQKVYPQNKVEVKLND